MFVLPFLRKNGIADTCYRDTVGQNKVKKRALRDSHLKIYPCELRLSSFPKVPVELFENVGSDYTGSTATPVAVYAVVGVIVSLEQIQCHKVAGLVEAKTSLAQS